MDQFFKRLQSINTIEEAYEELKKEIAITPKIQDIIDFCIKSHEGQFRKSGEPYVVHPILVATAAAKFSQDEAVVATALLHDIIEDTACTFEFVKETWGEDVAHMVDGLTKIVEIREHELAPSNSTNTKLISSALTFRKMLIASIDDARVLIVKLCDRLHNMLTLDALPQHKQLRIAEETLVVYVPIAHRLGISSIKNALEDLSFYYIYPQEYKKIDEFIKEHKHKIQLTFNKFISNTTNILEKNGFDTSKVKIISRVKHYYSIYMKMQRKGVNIDEILDLLAIRVLVQNDLDCYKILGIMHLEYKPLIARFKDYISTPKENGYRTIHTTVFYDSKIYEIQIRTFDMHKIAEFGIAAHWKYKSDTSGQAPNLNWLKSLEFTNQNIEEFYNDTKGDLYSEDIIVYSPKGDVYTLPRGATAYDFAFAIHSDIGSHSIECFINKVRKPLLTELKSSDIVSITTGPHSIARCSWYDMVKTSRAKKHIKSLCSQQQREINELSGKNIIDTVFLRFSPSITDEFPQNSTYKIPYTLDYLKHVKRRIEKNISKTKNFVRRWTIINRTLKEFKFDNILVYSNYSINSVLFDHCCHPKFGDDIVAFKDGNKAIIHHQMCDKAYNKIQQKEPMLYCSWIQDNVYQYKMLVSLPNSKGELALLLSYMAQYDIYILKIEYGREKHSYIQYCSIEFEINNSNIEEVRKLIQKKAKIIDFFSKKDAYQ